MTDKRLEDMSLDELRLEAEKAGSTDVEVVEEVVDVDDEVVVVEVAVGAGDAAGAADIGRAAG